MKKKRDFYAYPAWKKESKLEECCEIMDTYKEYLNEAFLTGFGTDL